MEPRAGELIDFRGGFLILGRSVSRSIDGWMDGLILMDSLGWPELIDSCFSWFAKGLKSRKRFESLRMRQTFAQRSNNNPRFWDSWSKIWLCQLLVEQNPFFMNFGHVIIKLDTAVEIKGSELLL